MKNDFISIPRATLNALKQVLFNDEDGVNLSPIINDLALEEDRDLTAINVALVVKGIKPKFDTTPRFARSWSKNSAFTRYNIGHISLILGKVAATAQDCNENGEPTERCPRTEILDVSTWLNMPTTIKEISK